MALMGVGGEGLGSLSDQLHWRYSGVVFLVLAVAHVVLQWLHYGQGLLRCNTPAHTTAAFRSYAQAECAAQEYLQESLGPGGPQYVERQDEEQTKVYMAHSSMVAAIFLLQALLFCSTQPVWCFLSARASGINVTSLVANLAKSEEGRHSQPRRDVISDAANTLKKYFGRMLRVRHQSYCFRWIHGNMLTLAYVLAKCLCLLNVIGQFYLIGALLQVNYPRYGFQALSRWTYVPGNISSNLMQALFPGMDAPILQMLDQKHDVRFPTQFYCDLRITKLGNIQRYIFQCSLPAQALLAPFFLFDWFWMAIVAMVTASSVVFLVCNMASLSCHVRGLMEALPSNLRSGSDDQNLCTDNTFDDRVAEFLGNYLRRDGFLLLHMISSATSKMVAEELTGHVWDDFIRNWADYQPLLAPPSWQEKYIEFPDEHHQMATDDVSGAQPIIGEPLDFRMEEIPEKHGQATGLGERDPEECIITPHTGASVAEM